MPCGTGSSNEALASIVRLRDRRGVSPTVNVYASDFVLLLVVNVSVNFPLPSVVMLPTGVSAAVVSSVLVDDK